MDIGIQRLFRITEKVGLRFRAEFFNILNHPNFGNPDNDLTSPLFGRSTQTMANGLGSAGANGGFNPLYQIGPEVCAAPFRACFERARAPLVIAHP